MTPPISIAPHTHCTSCLIALDKYLGICPIEVGDTARHIVAKAILNITQQDIQEATGFIYTTIYVLVRLLALKQLYMLSAPFNDEREALEFS